jgi:hypothetical protein
LEDKVFENLAGKYLIENTGQGRKIEGLVLASLFHIVFTGDEIESGPLEYFIDRSGRTFNTFYLDDKIFLDEDQLTEDEVREFFEDVGEKMPSLEEVKSNTLIWVKHIMTALNSHLLKRYPKYPGYERAVGDYKEYISCPEKLILGYYTPKNQVQDISTNNKYNVENGRT